eukprot:scaffold150489_cov30-Tisochrysis_lutea.AAC.2
MRTWSVFAAARGRFGGRRASLVMARSPIGRRGGGDDDGSRRGGEQRALHDPIFLQIVEACSI